MALQTVRLATCQVAGAVSPQVGGLQCLVIGGANLQADIAATNQAIIDDQQITSRFLSVPNATANQPGVIFTGSIAGSGATTITSFVRVSPTSATINSLRPGMDLTGPGLAPGTTVISVTGTTVTFAPVAYGVATTQTFAATGANLNGGYINGLLTVPNRGVLKVFPGDTIAWDVLGFPYLIPATSVNFNGGGLNSGAPFIVT